MFKLIDSNQLPGPKKLIQAGYPDKMEPDICIYDEFNIYAFLELNSKMLREALLANPAYTLITLGIKVEDKLNGRKKKW